VGCARCGADASRRQVERMGVPMMTIERVIVIAILVVLLVYMLERV